MKSTYLTLRVGTVFAVLALVAVDAYSCTRVFWSTNSDLMIVGRTEDYITASPPSLVATPRGVQRWGTADETKRSQAICWTNKHYRFKSLIAPSDVFFELDDYDFAEGQPVRLVKRIDLYAQKGWSGDLIPHLVEIDGDIYDQCIE